MQLAYLGIEVTDLPAWDRFMEDVAGLQKVSDDSTSTASFFRMDENARRFIVKAGPADDLVYAGFAVASNAELGRMRSEFESAGYKTSDLDEEALQERQLRNGFHCQDPFGHRVEFTCGPYAVLDKPFASPCGARFVADELGLGHIVLSADNEAKVVEFYQNIAGFRLSDIINLNGFGEGVKATFLHCNPRHHSLALLNVPGEKRLHHFMIQFDNIDDVGRSYDRCVASEFDPVLTIGRHTNDRMISYYAMTPSGVAVEIGAEGELIDDSSWIPNSYNAGSFWGHRPYSSPADDGAEG